MSALFTILYWVIFISIILFLIVTGILIYKIIKIMKLNFAEQGQDDSSTSEVVQHED